MKVLVAAPHMCDTHRPTASSNDELVVMLSCVECDEDQTMFTGLETGELYQNAAVAERNDIEYETLRHIVHVGLRRLFHLEDDQDIDEAHASQISDRITLLAGQLDVDTLIGREGERTFSVLWESNEKVSTKA